MNITSVGAQELYKIMFGVHSDSSGKGKVSLSEEAIKKSSGRDQLIVSEKFADPDTSSVISLFETGNKTYAGVYSVGGIGDDKKLASFFADIGKRLDEAYSEGKFTEEEYNELNSGFNDYISYMKDKNDTWRAEAEYNRSKIGYRNAMKVKEKIKTQSPEEFVAERKKAVDAILNRKGFRTPIEKMMEMINNLRYANAGILNGGIKYGIS